MALATTLVASFGTSAVQLVVPGANAGLSLIAVPPAENVKPVSWGFRACAGAAAN